MKTLLKIVFPIFIIIAFQVNTHAQSEYWRQIFGGPFVDIAYNCIELRDGGYMMAGYKEIQVPGQIWQIPKSYVVKFDRNGNILWEKLIGDSITYNKSYTLIEDNNGNIYLTVNSEYAHLIKLNRNGEILWDRDYSEAEVFSFTGISFVNNYEKIVLLSKTDLNNYFTSSITKLDSSGNLIWNKLYYDSIPLIYYFSYINSFLFKDDAYYISGQKGKGFILKTDTSGNVIWNKRYFETYAICSFAEYTNNSFVVSAYGEPGGKLICMNIDSSGNINWKKDYINDTLAGAVGAEKIIKNSINSFALGTAHGLNFGRLMIIDSLGKIITSKFYYYPLNLGIYQNNINNTSDSGFIIAGEYQTYFSDGKNFQEGDKIIDVLIYKIDRYGNTVWIKDNTGNLECCDEIEIHPNPFNTNFKLKFTLIKKSKVNISLFDISGRLIKVLENGFLNSGVYSKIFNASELSSGIYFLRILSNNKTFSRKVVLLK